MTAELSSAPAAIDTTATAWHTLDDEEVRQQLDTGSDGLDAAEAEQRLRQYGPNEVEQEEDAPWWSLLLHQFRDPLIYILLAAALVTLLLRDYADSGVILAVVLVNSLVGFIQELRAREAMRALSEMSAPHAEVIRGGQQRHVESRELVPGDVVVLASGARVPADVRLLKVRDLEIDESALTGESIAARKTSGPLESETLVSGDQTNMAFSGTAITRGRGRGIVVRTGNATELGRIASAMRDVGATVTPLQQKMHRLGRQIGVVVLAASALTVAVGLLRGMSPAEIFVTAVALAVSAIPEGLPVVLTVTLAIGVRRMARRHAIIRALPAVETLGSTTTIGSDKTGTLTKNEMTVRALWTAAGEFEVEGAGYGLEGEITARGNAPAPGDALHGLLLAATLANEADPVSVQRGEPAGDPTEIALHVAAAKGGIMPGEARETHVERDVLPFEPERRFMATVNEGPDGARIYLKGAPEAMLSRCDRMAAGDEERPLDGDAVRAAAAAMAARGLRVLAMASRSADADGRLDEETLGAGLLLEGLAGMEDPVRPEAIAAVADAHSAGIRVLMLTGDHVETARAIGAQLGIAEEESPAISGHDLQSLSDEELDEALQHTTVFARVAPEHKLRIVQRLKALGEVVAVTGDGVNDAPALRAAHLGVAMGITGTDVAREAADMVLADDNFATITAAIEEGRIVFANVRKVTFFLLSTGVGGVLTILVALFAGWPLPFVAVQILWINLVTNGLQDVALAFEPGEPGLLRNKPRPADEGVLSWRLVERLLGVGAVIAAGTLFVFWWTLRDTGSLDFARSMAMTQMVLFQFFHVFNCRSLDRSVLSIPPFSNRFLFASVIAALLAQLAVLHVPLLQRLFHTVPLGLSDWGLLVVVGSAVIVGGELDKWINQRYRRPLG